MKLNRHPSLIKHVLSFLLFIFLAGCAVDSTEVDNGFFIDAPVKGLMFESGSLFGRTDEDGRFYFEGNQPVTFSIEGAVLGEALPSSHIFPFDLFTSTLFVSDTRVNNMSRFLQSLDDDGDPDNGITIDIETRNAVTVQFGTATSLDFSAASFGALSSFLADEGKPVRSPESARTHLLDSLANYGQLKVDLIMLGDGFTAGVQSAKIGFDNLSSRSVNLHEFTQTQGYAAVMEGELRKVLGDNLTWGNPLLAINEDRSKELKSADTLHYNLAVPGATTQSVIIERTGSGNEMLDLLLTPIFNNWSSSYPAGITQLEAAEELARQAGHEQKLKIFTLWIGMNDVLGALTAGGGSELTTTSIDTFLDDTGAGHDLPAVMNNISTIVSKLTSVKDSYLFIATLPDVTKTGALFYEEDIEFLAQFDAPDITVLKNYTSPFTSNTSVVALGFSGFTSIAPYLNMTSNNTALDGAINALPDSLTLSRNEADLIKTRVSGINTYINGFADPEAYPHVFVIDMHYLFEEILPQTEVATGIFLDRGYGGGAYSMDGVYPSNTGYALIAKEFLKRIDSPYTIFNKAGAAYDVYSTFVYNKGIKREDGIGITVDAENISLGEIWNSDPYRDNDGDGFPDGPGQIAFSSGSSIPSADPSLDLVADCDDNNINTLPEVISGVTCN